VQRVIIQKNQVESKMLINVTFYDKNLLIYFAILFLFFFQFNKKKGEISNKNFNLASFKKKRKLHEIFFVLNSKLK
jgi:hypothetical protein